MKIQAKIEPVRESTYSITIFFKDKRNKVNEVYLGEVLTAKIARQICDTLGWEVVDS